MNSILVSGSLAYDYLYTFLGDFKSEILPGEGSLSVAFNVTDKTVNFGGCAGNIVFNGKLLGEDFVLLGIAGHDFEPYQKWLTKNKIDCSNVMVEESDYTAQASVVTDKKGQQITFFYEGAAARSAGRVNSIKSTIRNLEKIKFAIVSPNNREFMLATIAGCQAAKIPYFFDPGQAMPLFSPNELLQIVNAASGVFLNEYEFGMLQKQLKLKTDEILRLCPLLIVTLGENGSTVYFGENQIKVPTQKVKTLDPTGCGDAYRAGFLAGIKDSFPNLTQSILEEAGKLGTKLAVACLSGVGTQNHKL
ncbi:MAG: carbohydrate kinase family protein [Patescibacteria group bacterium]